MFIQSPIVEKQYVFVFFPEILASKSAANMSSDSVNISGAEDFFVLVPGEEKAELLHWLCIYDHKIKNDKQIDIQLYAIRYIVGRPWL